MSLSRSFVGVVVLAGLTIGGQSLGTPIRIGGIGGVSFSNVATSPSVSTGYRLTPQVGLIADLPFDPDFSLSTELSLLQWGFKSSGGDATQHILYLAVPLHLRAHFEIAPEIHPFLFLGPQLAYRLKAEAETPLGRVDNKTEIKALDLALNLGLGSQFRFSKTTVLHLDGRFGLGLTNANLIPGSTVSIKNMNFSILAGLLFGS